MGNCFGKRNKVCPDDFDDIQKELDEEGEIRINEGRFGWAGGPRVRRPQKPKPR